MKKILLNSIQLLKWIMISLLMLELTCFLVISASNYIIYGEIREGGRVYYDPPTLFLDAEGIRPTANIPHPTDIKPLMTIWLFGGSTMRGSTDYDDRTIPSYLAALLNTSDRKENFRLINFGENSFNSLLENKYLQKLLMENSPPPDLIIFYDGANDCSYFAQHRTPYAHHGYRRLKAMVESYRYSWFGLLKPINAVIYASFTKEVYDKVMQTMIPISPDSQEYDNFLELTEKRYDYLHKIAGFFQAKFLLFWQPIWWVESQEVSPEVKKQEKEYMLQGEMFTSIRQNFVIPYQAIKQRMGSKPYFVDFQNILCNRTKPVYQPDGVHLNDHGRKMVAQKMKQELQKRLGN
jgi:hypothetical protein